MRARTGKHYEPLKDADDDDDRGPVALRPILRHHPVDNMGLGEFEAFDDNYAGGVRDLIGRNLDTLGSYLDTLEDVDDLGVHLMHTRPVAKFRRRPPKNKVYTAE